MNITLLLSANGVQTDEVKQQVQRVALIEKYT